MIRRVLSGSALIMVLSPTLLMQAQGVDAVQQQVAAADKALTAAMTACSVEGMARLISDDAAIVRAAGDVVDKNQYLEMVIRPCILEHAQSESMRIRIYDTNTAVVLGNMTTRVKGQSATSGQFYTRVYNNRSGTWVLVQMSQTTAKAVK